MKSVSMGLLAISIFATVAAPKSGFGYAVNEVNGPVTKETRTALEKKLGATLGHLEGVVAQDRFFLVSDTGTTCEQNATSTYTCYISDQSPKRIVLAKASRRDADGEHFGFAPGTDPGEIRAYKNVMFPYGVPHWTRSGIEAYRLVTCPYDKRCVPWSK